MQIIVPDIFFFFEYYTCLDLAQILRISASFAYSIYPFLKPILAFGLLLIALRIAKTKHFEDTPPKWITLLLYFEAIAEWLGAPALRIVVLLVLWICLNRSQKY